MFYLLWKNNEMFMNPTPKQIRQLHLQLTIIPHLLVTSINHLSIQVRSYDPSGHISSGGSEDDSVGGVLDTVKTIKAIRKDDS